MQSLTIVYGKERKHEWKTQYGIRINKSVAVSLEGRKDYKSKAIIRKRKIKKRMQETNLQKVCIMRA